MFKFLKKHRVLMGIFAVILVVCAAIPFAALQMRPTAAAPGDPIVHKPGVPIDAAGVDYEIRRYEQYNDTSWTASNHTRSGTNTPIGVYTQGTSGYFNQRSPVLNPAPTAASPTGPRIRNHTLFFPKVFDDPATPADESQPSIVRFGGYQSPAWFDYVYTEQLDIQTMAFDIVPQQWDFHTMKRMGFFFLCERSPSPAAPVDKNSNGVNDYDANNSANTDYDTSNGTISGYMLSIGQIHANTGGTGTEHSTLEGPTQATVNFELYYVQDMNIDAYNAYLKSVTPARLTTGQNNFTSPPASPGSVTSSPAYNVIGPYLIDPAFTTNLTAYGFTATTTPFEGSGIGKALPNCSVTPVSIPRYVGLYDTTLPSQPNPSLPNYNPTSPAIPNYTYIDDTKNGTASRQGRMHFEVKTSATGFEIWLTDVGGVSTLAGQSNPAPLNSNNSFLLFKETFATESGGVVTPLPTRPKLGNGFGLYMQNSGHSCAQLTVSEFSSFEVQLNSAPEPIHPKVKYRNMNNPTGSPLAPDFVFPNDMWGGVDSYDVEPPPVITVGGKNYYYFIADRNPLTDIEILSDDTDADHETTLFYVEAPTMEKNANILRSNGSGGFTADPGNPHNGTPQDPFEINYNDRIEYEITISNPNAVALTGVPMQIVDTIPYGMKYLSSSPTASVTTNGRGQSVLKWDVASIPANGSLTFRVTVEVEKYGLVYVNGADLSAPDTGLDVYSNRVYHTSTLAPLDAQKDARIKNPVSGLYPASPSNGTSSSRVALGRDDTLKYTIDVTNPNPPYQGPSYDVVYNLDWSGSMSTPTNYRVLAKDVALKFSRKVFDNYPDSRVALMGTNSQNSHNLSGQREHFFLEVDSDFYADWQYTAAFDNIYPNTFAQDGDDMPLGLQASIEKLLGDNSKTYGGAPADPPPPATAIFPAVGTRQVNPRLDMSRIPVVIQLSDWELDVPGSGGNVDPNFGNSPTHPDPTLRPAWTRMRDQLTSFKTSFSDGVFIGVTFPGGNSVNNKNALTNAITALEPSPGKWGRVDALATHSADNLANLLWDEFIKKAPLFPNGCTVTDTLPPGLVTSASNVTVTVNGTVVSAPDVTVTVAPDLVTGQYVVTVEFEEFPEGEFSIDIVCTVASGHLTEFELDNKAMITYEHGGTTHNDETNTTYHELTRHTVKTTWQEYHSTSPFTNGPLGKADRTDIVNSGNNYSLQATDTDNITYNGKTYTYYGYSLDGGATVTTGAPPAPVLTNIRSDKEIILYFRTTYQIVEQFHDDASPYMNIFPDGSPITVYSGASWNPAAHATVIPPIRWIAGYPYTYDTTANQYKHMLDTNPKQLRTVGFSNIQEDHIVIYPYTKGPYTEFKVTETFRKLEDPTQRVDAAANPDIATNVPGGGDFDLASSIPPKDIGSFTYVGYSIDSGTVIFDMPPAPPDHLLEYVTAEHMITYYYAELASKTAQVYHGGTGTPDPEDTGTLMVPVIALPGDDILYIVKLTIPEGLAQSGSVTVTDVLPKGLTANNAGVSHGGTVSYNATTERYTVTWTIAFPTSPAPSGMMNLTVRADVVTRGTYVNQANVTLNDQDHIDPYTTNPTVHDHVLPGAKTLHIRQIILTRSPSTSYAELPPAGFFTAANNGTTTSLLSPSGLWGFGATPFAIYTFPESIDLEYLIDNLVPQHYEWKDYELTSDPSLVHDRTRLIVGRPALLDYQDEREYWLTVYLTPRPLSGAYSWGFKTNLVGSIYNILP